MLPLMHAKSRSGSGTWPNSYRFALTKHNFAMALDPVHPDGVPYTQANDNIIRCIVRFLFLAHVPKGALTVSGICLQYISPSPSRERSVYTTHAKSSYLASSEDPTELYSSHEKDCKTPKQISQNVGEHTVPVAVLYGSFKVKLCIFYYILLLLQTVCLFMFLAVGKCVSGGEEGAEIACCNFNEFADA